MAYETLSDPDARAAYDASHSLRRLNFFRDVDEDGAGSGSRRQQRGGWGVPADPQQADDPFEIHRCDGTVCVCVCCVLCARVLCLLLARLMLGGCGVC